MKNFSFLNIKDQFFKKTFAVVIIKAIGAFLTFLSLILITNFFSEDIVGKYNYANTILVLLGSLCLLGMNNSFLLFSGKLKAQKSFIQVINLYNKKIVVITTIFLFILLIYLLTTYAFYDYIVKYELKEILSKVIIGIPFFALCNLNFQVIRVLDKIILSEIFRNISRNIVLILSIFYIKEFCSPNLLLDYLIASFAIIGILSFICIKYLMSKLKKNIQNEVSVGKISYKEILKTSFPMTVSFFSLLIMQSIDIITLKFYGDYDKIALYGIIIRISSILVIFLSSINTIIAPKISEFYYSKKSKDLIALINKSIKLKFILTLPIALLILIFPDFFLAIFGKTYLYGKNALMIIIAGQIINCVTGSSGLYLNMTGRQKVFQRIILVTLLINIILNIILIPSYGIEGAAFSTSLSILIWNIYSVIYIYKKDGIIMFLNKGIF